MAQVVECLPCNSRTWVQTPVLPKKENYNSKSMTRDMTKFIIFCASVCQMEVSLERKQWMKLMDTCLIGKAQRVMPLSFLGPCRLALCSWTYEKCQTLSSFFVFNSFIEVYFTENTIHPFQLYDSVIFSIFTELCNHHHKQLLSPSKETLYPLPVILNFPALYNH
jgi:hypothetical protein